MLEININSWRSVLKRSLTFDFEAINDPHLTIGKFLIRCVIFFLIALSVLAFFIFIGTLSYIFTENLSCEDSIHMACMIMAGNGPIVELTNPTAKVFSSIYAVFSSVLILVIAGITFIPIGHRIHHRVHYQRKSPNPTDRN